MNSKTPKSPQLRLLEIIASSNHPGLKTSPLPEVVTRRDLERWSNVVRKKLHDTAGAEGDAPTKRKEAVQMIQRVLKKELIPLIEMLRALGGIGLDGVVPQAAATGVWHGMFRRAKPAERDLARDPGEERSFPTILMDAGMAIPAHEHPNYYQLFAPAFKTDLHKPMMSDFYKRDYDIVSIVRMTYNRIAGLNLSALKDLTQQQMTQQVNIDTAVTEACNYLRSRGKCIDPVLTSVVMQLAQTAAKGEGNFLASLEKIVEKRNGNTASGADTAPKKPRFKVLGHSGWEDDKKPAVTNPPKLKDNILWGPDKPYRHLPDDL